MKPPLLGLQKNCKHLVSNFHAKGILLAAQPHYTAHKSHWLHFQSLEAIASAQKPLAGVHEGDQRAPRFVCDVALAKP